MDLTTKEVARNNDLPIDGLLLTLWPIIDAAMKQYAEQEARAYASWLSNQVHAGRTASRLWADYKAEALDQQPNT